jgi:DNA invertase Pin-like site-specific DNA recombinase
LRAAGATKVFSEKISGAITDRKALGRAIAALSSGDTLIVTRLDRLARSTGDPLTLFARYFRVNEAARLKGGGVLDPVCCRLGS